MRLRELLTNCFIFCIIYCFHCTENIRDWLRSAEKAALQLLYNSSIWLICTFRSIRNQKQESIELKNFTIVAKLLSLLNAAISNIFRAMKAVNRISSNSTRVRFSQNILHTALRHEIYDHNSSTRPSVRDDRESQSSCTWRSSSRRKTKNVSWMQLVLHRVKEIRALYQDRKKISHNTWAQFVVYGFISRFTEL